MFVVTVAVQGEYTLHELPSSLRTQQTESGIVRRIWIRFSVFSSFRKNSLFVLVE